MSTDQQKYYGYLNSEDEQIRVLEAKEWRIYNWRESVSTPPESDLHFVPTKDGFNSLKRKRSSQSLDSNMATGPAKRKRGQLASDGSNLDSSPPLSTPSGILSLQPRLVMSSRSSHSKSTSPKRSPSPAGKLLNALRTSRPAIDCRALDDRRPVPPSVRSLRKALAKDIGVGIIPTNLKTQLQEVDPEGFDDIPNFAFGSDASKTEGDLKQLWDAVFRIRKAARSCKDYGKDENAWCLGVVQKVLEEVIGASESSLLELDSVQSQLIDPTFLPAVDHIPVNKKADYALAFTPDNLGIGSLYNKLSLGGHNYTLSHMSDTYTSRIAIFCGIEVKSTAGSETEALAQLAIWSAGALENLRKLGCFGLKKRGERYDRYSCDQLLPIPGWTIVGNEWRLYIAYKSDSDESDAERTEEDENDPTGIDQSNMRVSVVGPISALNASTNSYHEIFKLLDLVKRVDAWARDVYWPWLEEQILRPLV
ncbi:MAG: hypothetical protein M1839_002756 [Geoglossum umbratile]|nr:MAG: hypothetical protein M1839_002756 [Geoglossum umbratile]